MFVGQREGQGRVGSWPLRRQGVPEAVDADFAFVLARRDHVGPRRKEGNLPNVVWRLVVLNLDEPLRSPVI